MPCPTVALYPLSSPNHNHFMVMRLVDSVALYPLSSPNHNCFRPSKIANPLRYILFHHQTTTSVRSFTHARTLRYILFHHQTTTFGMQTLQGQSCVISSFITKPQQVVRYSGACAVALYPLSSPNHNLLSENGKNRMVALYPLSSPNHNGDPKADSTFMLRYILFHHQTTTPNNIHTKSRRLRYILFHHQTTTEF